MKRFPFLLAVVLFVMWLLLNNSLAPGHIVLGALLAFFIARSSHGMRPLQPHVRRLLSAIPFTFMVFVDIVRSNIAVGRIVLGLARTPRRRSGFLRIPLDLRAPHGLAALAVIVTSTPGTVWVGLSPTGDTLTLHVLDLLDEDEWIKLIKERYERPLMRIFE